MNVNPDINIGNGGTSAGSSSNIIYFKDTIPAYDSSYTIEQTDKTKLKELLLSWGFSDVNIDGVTAWKISEYDNGPRLEWKGNLFVKDIGLQYLKCKNKDKSSYQECDDLDSNGYILLNTDATSNGDWKWIYISELGFGMERNYSFLWQDKISPAGLVKFDPPSSFDNNDQRYIMSKVDNWPFWGKVHQVLLRNFRIQEKDYVSGYQLPYYSVYTNNIQERGYYNTTDALSYPLTMTKFFNMGFPTVIGTNFYDREKDYANISLNNNIFSFNGTDYDTSKYDIFLYYIPPLNWDDIRIHMSAPAIDKPQSSIPMGCWRTHTREKLYEPASDKGDVPECSEVFYNIKLARDIDSENSTTAFLAYKDPIVYELITGNDTDVINWNNMSWKKSKRDFNQFIKTKDINLVYEVTSYFDEMQNIIKNEDEYSINKKRCIVSTNSYYATAYFRFTIPLKNIPYFINTSYEHNYNFSTNIGNDIISVGKISGKGDINGTDDNSVNTGFILWSLNNYLGDGLDTASICPEINLGTQTVYRSTTSLLYSPEASENPELNKGKKFFGRYESNIDANIDNLWPYACLDLAGKNDTTDVGFYCLIGIKKEA